jgi:hypothetical protein
MIRSNSRAGWAIVIPAVLLGAWVVGSSNLARRARVGVSGLLNGQHGAPVAGRSERSRGKTELPAAADRMDDARLSSLRGTVESWRKSAAPRRLVVDQVCLVRDLAAFLEAIAGWDERHFYPILIDEPAWTLPFLRSFRPARVVRFSGSARARGSTFEVKGPGDLLRSEATWLTAIGAVRRACSTPPNAAGTKEGSPGDSGPAPRTPGLVLADPDSATIGAAVALAAGHFQPLVRLGAFHLPPGVRGASESTRRLGDVLSLPEAWGFARRVEARVAASILKYDQLGDDCDFLTLAGDWPYRYEVDGVDGPARGIYALDDLIGRALVGGPSPGGIERSRRRWAYTGRMIGDPAASVARAMGTLFLHPRSALLWNTYQGGTPWSTYTVKSASEHLRRLLPGPIEQAEGPQADLNRWHRTALPVNRFGLFFINTSGGQDNFSITGGRGRPGDVPRGALSAVAMIHSFSAANLADPQTIAGRWLANGAYVYFGAVHEPFLVAFRPPGLVTELIAADVPLVAALRQCELEPFGLPWRLIYLGDPLYRVGRISREKSSPAANAPNNGSKGPEQRATDWNWWGSRTALSSAPVDQADARIDAIEWTKAAAPHELPGLAPILAMDAKEDAPLEVRESGYDAEKLRLCVDAAIAEAASPDPNTRPSAAGQVGKTTSPRRQPNDWRTVLRQIRRERLEETLREVYDALLIDALEEVRALDELQASLARIPPEESGPRVWQAHELCAFDRLARLNQDRSSETFDAALRIWDEVMGLSWPKGSQFPGQLTERVAAMTGVDPGRRLALWQEQLRKTAERLEPHRERFPHVAAIVTERTRVEAQRARR